jgi:hypothetical protein
MTFPTARRTRDGWVYGGRHFKSRDEVVDAMSDRDYRRSVDWETRHVQHLRRLLYAILSRYGVLVSPVAGGWVLGCVIAGA